MVSELLSLKRSAAMMKIEVIIRHGTERRVIDSFKWNLTDNIRDHNGAINCSKSQ